MNKKQAIGSSEDLEQEAVISKKRKGDEPM